jgi:hypothetical protein
MQNGLQAFEERYITFPPPSVELRKCLSDFFGAVQGTSS